MRARFSVQPPPWLDIDVTMLQLKTLMGLFCTPGVDASQGLRVSDLARQLAVTAATASTLVDRLVERGLVERREDPQDRRQHRCRVSAAGQELLARFCEAARSQSSELLEVLSDQELEAVLRGITLMIRAAERVAGAVIDRMGVLEGTPSPPPSPRGRGGLRAPSSRGSEGFPAPAPGGRGSAA
jgi:DNA-binding MarR family transcriptional regulator